MYKKKSNKFPTLNKNSTVLEFVKLTCNEILKINTSRNSQDNLTEAELEALKSLEDNPIITIKHSDKGGNIIIMNNENYVDMCNRIVTINNGISKSPLL